MDGRDSDLHPTYFAAFTMSSSPAQAYPAKNQFGIETLLTSTLKYWYPRFLSDNPGGQARYAAAKKIHINNMRKSGWKKME